MRDIEQQEENSGRIREYRGNKMREVRNQGGILETTQRKIKNELQMGKRYGLRFRTEIQ